MTLKVNFSNPLDIDNLAPPPENFAGEAAKRNNSASFTLCQWMSKIFPASLLFAEAAYLPVIDEIKRKHRLENCYSKFNLSKN